MAILKQCTTPPSLSPQDSITAFLKRNARLIIGVGLFVTFWMLVYTFAVYKPSFGAKSVVIIKDSAITGRYIEPDQYYALQTTSSSSSNPVLNTMGILKSGAISDALWVYFQAKHPEQLKKNKIKTKKDWDAFYQDGSAFIKAKNQPGTDLIAIQFSWSDPLIAKEALAVVLTAFQNASRDLNRSEQATRTQFLAEQVEDIEGQLAAIRKEKTTYQSTNRTVSVKREGDDLAGSRMELSNKLSQIESHARGKENLSRRYQQLLGMSPEKALKASALGQNSSITRLQDELYRLQQQYSLLNTSLTEANPKVKEVQSQIEQVQANLAAEQARTMGASSAAGQTVVADSTRGDLVKAMLTAHGEAQDLRSQAAVIRNRLGQINADISGFPQKAEGLANIEQKEASLSIALDHLRQKVLEGRLKEEQTLSNVFIVDAPTLPAKAQFPTQSHLIVLSLFMGLGMGVATAFAKEQLFSSRNYNLPEWLEPLEKQPLETQDEGQSDNPGGGDAKIQPVPVHQPQSQDTPVAQSALVSALHAEPGVEKVVIPVVGSLFDSLVPVASPMRHQQAELVQNEAIRRDLTRPLVQPPPAQVAQASTTLRERKPEVIRPVSEPTFGPDSLTPPPSILRPDFEIQEVHLSPPEAAMPARSVKMATTPSPITVAQAQADHIAKTAVSARRDLEGVPVMHTNAASNVEVVESDPFQFNLGQPNSDQPDNVQSANVPASAEHPQRPITHEPILFKAPAQVNVVAETPAPELPVPGRVDEAAVSQYEEQAKKMPLPRKLRGVPAFLLDSGDAPQDAVNLEISQPYTLVSKKASQKQFLSAGDDLTQTVAPLEAPAQAQAMEHQHFLPFPDEMASTETFKPRKSFIQPIWFGKKPARHPEAYFGLRNGRQKRAELPTSLNRLMSSIQNHPAGYDV